MLFVRLLVESRLLRVLGEFKGYTQIFTCAGVGWGREGVGVGPPFRVVQESAVLQNQKLACTNSGSSIQNHVNLRIFISSTVI